MKTHSPFFMFLPYHLLLLSSFGIASVRLLLRSSVCYAVLAVSLCAAPYSSFAAAKPNILVFSVDDVGWCQPGCYGGMMAPTPNMDSLAASGVRFTDGYSSGCICTPGRVGLMTGRYQARTGHDANTDSRGRELALTETTIAQRLKALGKQLRAKFPVQEFQEPPAVEKGGRK
jgi:Sulfatase